jgi:hypothetical protein
MAMRAMLSIGAAILGGLLTTDPVVAHHTFAAEYDGTKPATRRGVVTKMEWINPHAWIISTSRMPMAMAKDGTKFANGRDMTFTDGKKLFIGSSGTGARDERPEK